MKNLLVDRVAFSIFGQDIYFYGLIITAAIVIDFFVLCGLVKKFNNKFLSKNFSYPFKPSPDSPLKSEDN